MKVLIAQEDVVTRYFPQDSFTRPACLRLYCILMAGVGIVLSATWVATSAHVLVQQQIQDQRYNNFIILAVDISNHDPTNLIS